MVIYTVSPGDSMYSIAKKYGVTLSDLERFNRLPDNTRLAVGEDILIPVKGTVHDVKSGDSLYSIALHHGISLEDLINANPDLRPPYTIYPGDIIMIPQGNASKKAISVNGYAYPSINREVLTETLPYLTYLSIFSRSVSPDGSLSDLEDGWMISTAKNYNTAPVMVVTNTEPGAGFSSELAHTVLTNASVRSTLIDNIVSTAAANGYEGVDIDFEYIFPSDRESYNEFLTLLKAKTEPAGLSLSTAIAPKISAGQRGTLYEAHDYSFHGSIVDYLIIMTYEWGYLYGPPLAVAPISEVRKVLSYAVTEIESSKILMGMPNYGYDWTLPYKSGTAANILSIDAALKRAIDVGANIQFNETSAAPFYEYVRDGREHIVWFENARSTAARLELVNEFGLGGVSYWTINQFYAQNWRILEDMFNIRKIL